MILKDVVHKLQQKDGGQEDGDHLKGGDTYLLQTMTVHDIK